VLWLGTFPGLIHRERPDFAYTLSANGKQRKKSELKRYFLSNNDEGSSPISPRQSLIRKTINLLNF
jgi:hypothetical protein